MGTAGPSTWAHPHSSASLHHLLQPPRPCSVNVLSNGGKTQEKSVVGAEKVPGVEMALL